MKKKELKRKSAKSIINNIILRLNNIVILKREFPLIISEKDYLDILIVIKKDIETFFNEENLMDGLDSDIKMMEAE